MTKPKKPTKKQSNIMDGFKGGVPVVALAEVYHLFEWQIEQAIRVCMLWEDRNGKK